MFVLCQNAVLQYACGNALHMWKWAAAVAQEEAEEEAEQEAEEGVGGMLTTGSVAVYC